MFFPRLKLDRSRGGVSGPLLRELRMVAGGEAAGRVLRAAEPPAAAGPDAALHDTCGLGGGLETVGAGGWGLGAGGCWGGGLGAVGEKIGGYCGWGGGVGGWGLLKGGDMRVTGSGFTAPLSPTDSWGFKQRQPGSPAGSSSLAAAPLASSWWRSFAELLGFGRVPAPPSLPHRKSRLCGLIWSNPVLGAKASEGNVQCMTKLPKGMPCERSSANGIACTERRPATGTRKGCTRKESAVDWTTQYPISTVQMHMYLQVHMCMHV